MSQESSNQFHEQLLFFLQSELIQKKKQEGWDDRFDVDLREYHNQLSQAIRSSALMPLDEIIDRHQYLFSYRGPIHLEQKILQAFNDKEMTGLNLKPVRIYRGLPRQYCKNQMSFSKIKAHFSYLPDLLRKVASKPLFSLYSNTKVPMDAKIALICDVFSDGLGDYYASYETAKLIQNSFPGIDLRIFGISEKKMTGDGKIFASEWVNSDDQLQYLASCDLILQMPTRSIKIEEIRKNVQTQSHSSSQPIWETVGEYGFVDSDWFHPQTDAYCMGLHFLEVGILTRSDASQFLAKDLQNKDLLEWLFGISNDAPVLDESCIAKYRQNHRFFLGYLYSYAGTFVYLHALCKSLENDSKDIDVCIPDSAKLFAYFDQRLKEGKDILEKGYRIRSIEIHIDQHVAEWKMGEEGKVLRILCPGALQADDFRRLLALSEDFVAMRGNQSLSECISHNKSFLYDPRDHSRYFVKDLIALAENCIPEYRTTLEVIRLFSKILEYNLPSEEGDWIDEIAIQRQEPMELITIAEKMGEVLKDPKTLLGFKKLNKTLIAEHSCNDFLKHLVQRTLYHRRHPEMVLLEKKAMDQFVKGEQPFSFVIEQLSLEINSLL